MEHSQISGKGSFALARQRFSRQCIGIGISRNCSILASSDPHPGRRSERGLDDGLRLFFSGDNGYFDGFAEIGRRFGSFDVAMVETGAYDKRWSFVYMQLEQTMQALRGRWLLPIYNGTFDLAMHAWIEPFERISALAVDRGLRWLRRVLASCWIWRRLGRLERGGVTVRAGSPLAILRIP